jgi:methionine synthase II (cobalamin-independent)
LKEIYKLCKTDEDLDEEDEDSDSIERANELFNSMLKKVNQSEEILLEMSSFHSEYDGSIDLSERQMNDESFKLGTHAFSKIQTMNSINTRHEDVVGVGMFHGLN